MFGFDTLFGAVGVELSRAITGRLFNDDQIRSVAKSAIGKYFADWLLEPADEHAAKERVEEARLHIDKASSIITQMQRFVESALKEWHKLPPPIRDQVKKKLAERYGHLAATNKGQSAAFRSEIEELLRKELVAQAERGRRLRQAASFAIWLFTLIVGASLGAYFKDVVAWVKVLAA